MASAQASRLRLSPIRPVRGTEGSRGALRCPVSVSPFEQTRNFTKAAKLHIKPAQPAGVLFDGQLEASLPPASTHRSPSCNCRKRRSMAEHDRRNGGSRGGYQNRKRRYRGRLAHLLRPLGLLCSPCQADVHAPVEDDDYDHRPQRRRYEEPVYVRLRKELLGLAESVSASEAPADRGELIVL